jgi:hypothetical protein
MAEMVQLGSWIFLSILFEAPFGGNTSIINIVVDVMREALRIHHPL